MRIDPDEISGREAYFLMISSIVPRPIAFVSTQDTKGVQNLAPFSYFNGICSKPPLLSLSIGHRRWEGELVKKDTLQNIEQTREFVVNIATESLLKEVNASAAEYPPDVSEIEALGLTPIASHKIKPPRIQESPVQMECRLERVLMLGNPPLSGLVIGEVVCFHIEESVWDQTKKMVDAKKLKPVARLGGNFYSTLGNILSLTRPDWQKKQE